MSWSPDQIKLLHIVKSLLHWDEPKYRLLLQNLAGVRSSKNLAANMAGFRRVMAFAESEGFQDRRHDHEPDYWRKQAAEENPALKLKIQKFHATGIAAGVFAPDGLPGFIEHQTKGRLQGPTTTLEECDALDLYRILEGLKGWGYREARKRGIRLDQQVVPVPSPAGV